MYYEFSEATPLPSAYVMHLPKGDHMTGSRTAELCMALSVLLVLLSVSFSLLHWRVENEPGADSVPSLLLVRWALLIAGVSGFLLFAVRYFRDGQGSVLRLFGVIGITVCLYLPLFGITLLMMV